MAVPAGRSVVFVTGNAKKLEEVRIKHFMPEADCKFKVVLFSLNPLRQDTRTFYCLYAVRVLCWLNIGSEHEL